MKIRQGFVSNSSSSSFLIYGICLDTEEICKQMGIEYDPQGGYKLERKIEAKVVELGMDYFCPYDDNIYIGVSWDDVGDDETGLQFKARVVERLKALLPKADSIVPETYEYAWGNY